MIPLNKISTLIFDFGGVIINLDLPLCIRNLKAIGALDAEKYLSNFGQAGFFLQWEKGEIDLPRFRYEIRNISEGNPSDEDIDAAWCSFLQDIPESRIQLLLELKKKYRLLLLSNSNPLHIDVSAKNEFGKYGLSLNDVFEHCFISYQMGMTKPDPAIFHKLLNESGLNAGECLFLDDGAKNVEVARSLGIPSYLVKQGENLDFLLEKELNAADFHELNANKS
jgi:HAD superfamily hydrolase (TIGR01509 family)